MVEAVDSQNMAPKVNGILNLLWVGTWTYHLSIATTILVKLLEISSYWKSV